jgi:hypothetical protein
MTVCFYYTGACLFYIFKKVVIKLYTKDILNFTSQCSAYSASGPGAGSVYNESGSKNLALNYQYMALCVYQPKKAVEEVC